MEGTVYVIQQPRPNKQGWMPDLSSANKYGKIEYVFGSHERIYALPGPSLFKARKIFREFNQDQDYILWPGVGDPAALVVAMIALMECDIDYFKQLYWDRKRDDNGQRTAANGFYVPLTHNIKEKRHGN